MRILIAPDSFKGSLTAAEVCEHVARGLEGAVGELAEGFEGELDLDLLPLSDGGEGFVETMLAAQEGSRVETSVRDPLGREVKASFGMVEEGPAGVSTAVIEMAAASGLPLLSRGELNPLRTSTVGTGDLLAAALERGAERVLLGIGGSATVDGGVGLATRLGYRFLDRDGEPIEPTGGELEGLARIDASGRDPRLEEVEIQVACDVDNPLTGERGAAAVFGPQKGATPEMVETLDRNLAHLAKVVRRDLEVEIEDLPGAGAAGGLGGGLVAFAGAELRSGIEMVLDQTGFDRRAQQAQLVLTGEGRLDGQSLQGKVLTGVARRAGGRPVVALAGALGEGLGQLHAHGVAACFSILDRVLDEEEAFERAGELLERTAGQVLRLLLVGRGL